MNAAFRFLFLAVISTAFISPLAFAADSKDPKSKKPKVAKTKSHTKPKSRSKVSSASPVSKSLKGPLYFYPVTHDDSTGWIYVIPFCRKLQIEEFRTFEKHCKRIPGTGQRCITNKTADLKEAGGVEEKPFKLDYFVFTEEKECVQDRESYTSGDVVPFR